MYSGCVYLLKLVLARARLLLGIREMQSRSNVIIEHINPIPLQIT
jgi:hypothetical protein